MIKTGMNYLNINGERVSTGLGYRFIFHNTALQPKGGLDVFSSHELHNAVSRNNIFYSRGRTYPQDRGEPRQRLSERSHRRVSRRRLRALDVSAVRAPGVVSWRRP